MKMKTMLKRHLKQSICDTINLDSKDKITFIDNSNYVDFREIICDIPENTATLHRKNRQTNTTIKRNIGIDELLLMEIKETFEFDKILENRHFDL